MFGLTLTRKSASTTTQTTTSRFTVWQRCCYVLIPPFPSSTTPALTSYVTDRQTDNAVATWHLSRWRQVRAIAASNFSSVTSWRVWKFQNLTLWSTPALTTNRLRASTFTDCTAPLWAIHTTHTDPHASSSHNTTTTATTTTTTTTTMTTTITTMKCGSWFQAILYNIYISTAYFFKCRVKLTCLAGQIQKAHE